jgi:hypothetical protein
MRKRQEIAAFILVALLVVAAYGLFRTSQPSQATAINAPDRNSAAQGGVVDQSPLATAQRLAALASGEDEQPFAQEALRLADHEVDLAFASALRNAAQHPPVLSTEARELQTRMLQGQSALDNDKERVTRLTAEEAKAEGTKKIALADELEIAKAQQELDQDEVDDAKQDLIRAGGDPQGRIQAMVQEHEAATHETPALSAIASGPAPGGLVHRVQQWIALQQRQTQLAQAQKDALAAAAALSTKHDSLVAQVGDKKASDGEAARKAGVNQKAEVSRASDGKSAIQASIAANHAQAKVLVKATKERSAQQGELATYDKRIESYKAIAGVYEKWSAKVSVKKRATMRRAIWGATIILSILLVALFFTTWLDRLLGTLKLARRQVDTLRAVMRLTLQIFAVLLILLVIFGPPGQLGTFLGLAGAGLTVALKDFIVSFVGWFVLMGRNGIRLGDWVEINGVSGEVVELGMFHTVLLETGNWTDSGHPTGRRVTFTNSFAIEGHYFNFSTSGQWLWDELQIVIPAGKDPFPIVDAVQSKVQEVTAQSAALAEKEWQRAARSRDMSVMSAAPAINVRPVIGGIELGVRYITRANERYQLRAKLYHVAVDLLAEKNISTPENAAGEVRVGVSGAPAGSVEPAELVRS